MSDTPRTDANYVCHYGDGIGQWVSREFACELERELAAAQAQRDKAVFALQGLLEDITDYQTINNLGGENNHWQVIARAVLKECGK